METYMHEGKKYIITKQKGNTLYLTPDFIGGEDITVKRVKEEAPTLLTADDVKKKMDEAQCILHTRDRRRLVWLPGLKVYWIVELGGFGQGIRREFKRLDAALREYNRQEEGNE